MSRKLSSVLAVIFLAILILQSCGEGVSKDEKPVDIKELTKNQDVPKGPIITENQIPVTNPLNQEWVTGGKQIYDVKCGSCHKLTEERLVGPGWKDVTKRRSQVWIMNMITNTDYMLDVDTAARKLLELCMVRMPNQNLSFDEARHVLEFQRSNDGEK